jgi:hypothetical protein
VGSGTEHETLATNQPVYLLVQHAVNAEEKARTLSFLTL